VTGGSFDANGRYGIEARQANDVEIDSASISANAMGGMRLSGVAQADVVGVTFAGNANMPLTIDSGYVQIFGDTDALNDRWIPTSDVRLDGVLQFVPVVVPGVPVWSYTTTDNSDVIVGSDGRDVVAAQSGDDWVATGLGDDVLYGNDGNDTLDGGAGSDALFGGAGDDWLIYSGSQTGAVEMMDGGAGIDTADFASAEDAVHVNLLSGGIDASLGGRGIVDLTRVENVHGSVFGDTLRGDATANSLSGLGGADTLIGNGGADRLDGGAGDDTLVGGLHKDVLTGGAGRDVFRFGVGDGSDAITDFVRGIDVIDLLGVASFGQLRLKQVGADAQIKMGSDVVLLHGVVAATLTAHDFQFH
jgi:Ca2+-binding RTX toxin-like protein